LLFDPTDGKMFFYKLLAIGNGEMPTAEAFKSASDEHEKELTTRERLEFMGQLGKEIETMRDAVK
ncbi:MAG: hypothetical protein AAB393_10095, partial [Bacteroidota bacterium]